MSVIDVALQGAIAAYDVTHTGKRTLPPGFSLVGLIEADSAIIPTQHESAAMLAESRIFGFVAKSDHSVLVSIRGTQTQGEWLEDFAAFPQQFFAVPEAGFVHGGFQDVYRHIRTSLFDLIRGPFNDYQDILVTGHSLGAAVALLAAVDLFKSGVGLSIAACTFAGPRVWAVHNSYDNMAYIANTIPVCSRIVNKWDLVPHVPPSGLFEHVGSEQIIDGGFTTDFQVAHSLASYKAGLSGVGLLAA